MARKDAALAIRQFQSEIDAIRHAPEPWAMGAAIHVLAGFLVLGFALLFVARVDRVVSSGGGKIVATVPTIVIQALDPSIIKTIEVKEGERVTRGQTLATLDPTFAAADVRQLRQKLAALDAQIARADAELAESKPAFASSEDADVKQAAAAQQGLFDQRAAQYVAQISSYDQKIAQTEASQKKLADDAERYRQREQISKQVRDMRVILSQKGAGSLLNELQSRDTHLEMLRTLESNKNALSESEHQLKSLRADREAFRQQWLGAISQELVAAKTSRYDVASQLEKAVRRQDLVKLSAPEDAIILTVAKLSVGSILKEGESLITAMPAYAPVEAEAQFLARDVGFMRAGDPVTVKVDAFNYSEHGVALGTVRWISEGAFTLNENGQPADPYYKARIHIDETRFVDVPATMRLIPGMTLTADVKVGRRSLADYLFKMIFHGAGNAMREP